MELGAARIAAMGVPVVAASRKLERLARRRMTDIGDGSLSPIKPGPANSCGNSQRSSGTGFPHLDQMSQMTPSVVVYGSFLCLFLQLL